MTPLSLGPPSGQLVLGGVDWQFPVAPVTSLMIGGLPAPPPVLVPVPVLVPQAAAAVSRPATPTTTPSDLRLLMCPNPSMESCCVRRPRGLRRGGFRPA